MTQKSTVEKNYDQSIADKIRIESLNKQINFRNDSLLEELNRLQLANTELNINYLASKKELEEIKKNNVIVTSGYLDFLTPKNCRFPNGRNHNDNKDDNTKIDASVTGSFGNVNAVAYRHYEEKLEFNDDGTSHQVPLIIGDETRPNLLIFAEAVRCCHQVKISIRPEGRFTDDGNDTWVFKVRLVLNLSDGSAITTNYSQCVELKEKQTQNIKLY